MKNDPFAALAANVDDGFKVYLINPKTWSRIKDKDGNFAYIEVLSADSAVAETFDRERAKLANSAAALNSITGASEEDDTPEVVAKVGALTKSWHLVDPRNGEVIDLPCTAQNATKLYKAGRTKWIYRQVMPQVGQIANFMTDSSED